MAIPACTENADGPQKKLLERHCATGAAVVGLATSVTVLNEVARATNTALASIAALLTVTAGSQADLGRRAIARRG